MCNYCNREPGSYGTILAHFVQSQPCKKAAGDKSTCNTNYFLAHRHAVKFPVVGNFKSELLDLDNITNSTDNTGPIALAMYNKYLNSNVVDTLITGNKQLPDVPDRYLRKSNVQRQILFNLLCHTSDTHAGLLTGPPLWLYYNQHLLLKLVKVERDDEEEADEMYYTIANEYIFVWSIPDFRNNFVDVSVEAVRRDWPEI